MELSFIGLGFKGCKDIIDMYNTCNYNMISQNESFEYEALFSGKTPRATLVDMGHNITSQAILNEDTLRMFTENINPNNDEIEISENSSKSLLSSMVEYNNPDFIDVPSLYSSFQEDGIDPMNSTNEVEVMARTLRDSIEDSLRHQWESANHVQSLFVCLSGESGWSALLPEIYDITADYIPKKPVVVNTAIDQINRNYAYLIDKIVSHDTFHLIQAKYDTSGKSLITRLNFFANSSPFPTRNVLDTLEMGPSLRFLNSRIENDLVVPLEKKPFAMNHFLDHRDEEVLEMYRKFGPKFLDISSKFIYRVSRPLKSKETNRLIDSESYSSWISSDTTIINQLEYTIRRQKLLCTNNEQDTLIDLLEDFKR